MPGDRKGKGAGKASGGAKGGAARAGRPKPVVTDRACPDCGANLVIRSGRRGQFLGCSSYPKCRHTENLPDDLQETDAAEGG